MLNKNTYEIATSAFLKIILWFNKKKEVSCLSLLVLDIRHHLHVQSNQTIAQNQVILFITKLLQHKKRSHGRVALCQSMTTQ
jgi:hypothetical protein